VRLAAYIACVEQMRTVYKILVGKYVKKNLYLGERMILKWILKKLDLRACVDLIHMAQHTVTCLYLTVDGVWIGGWIY
jgi:hypothetical protein